MRLAGRALETVTFLGPLESTSAGPLTTELPLKNCLAGAAAGLRAAVTFMATSYCGTHTHQEKWRRASAGAVHSFGLSAARVNPFILSNSRG
jgi:hypothetical protein